MQHLEHVDELLAESVLERRALTVDPARHQQYFLVLDVDALHRADAFGKIEDLRFAERLGDEPATVLLPDHRRVEALLNGGPDGERRREVVSLHGEVGAVTNAEFVNIAEHGVGRVAREHVGQPRFDAETNQRQPPRCLPLRLGCELLITEFDPGQLVGLIRMALGQTHRHIEIVSAAGQCAVEDRHHKAGVDGIDHVGDALLAHQLGNRFGRTCVDAGRAEAGIVDRVGRLLGPDRVVIGHHDVLEEIPPHRD